MWSCTVDDERFSTITPIQWDWYANMVILDAEREADKMVNIAEYLAAFWNAEAVRKIKDMREARDSDRFMSDDEFEEMLDKKSFEDSEMVKSIVRSHKDLHANYKTESMGNDITSSRYSRLPKNFSDLSSYIKDED
jgi:hypothetical protein